MNRNKHNRVVTNELAKLARRAKGANVMRRLLTVLLVFMLAAPLFIASYSLADVKSIKVVPYPKTAGKMASYQISFNVTRPLSANQDSITVTLPKETMVPEYVSSSVISINPKTQIGADYKLNFATGDITFTNPLREGDSVRASYTYEADPTYTMMPIQADVKFFDRSFPNTPDPRNNNGQFDPGEWVYEDRNHDGRISPGDRRLMVIKGVIGAVPAPGTGWPNTSGTDARQNSIVASGDGDCGDCGVAGSTPSFPLQPLSLIKLTMVDLNEDGIYNEGDYLFDDRDQSGTVSVGDNMLAGLVYYPPLSAVAFNDPDANGRIVTGVLTLFTATPTVVRHVDNGLIPSVYDPGEAIYRECGTPNYIVDQNDIRLTTVSVMSNGVMYYYSDLSVVAVGDKDYGTRLVDFKIVPGEQEAFLDNTGAGTVGSFDPGEPIYRNGNGRVTFTGNPAPGDIRLSFWSAAAYRPTTVVAAGEADDGTQLVPFNTPQITKAELFTEVRTAVGTNFTNYTGAMYDVGTSNTSTSNPTTDDQSCPPALPAYINPGIVDRWIYRDMDGSNDVTAGDIRLTSVDISQGPMLVSYSAGSIVKAGELDLIPLSSTTQPLKLLSSSDLALGLWAHSETIRMDNIFEPEEYVYNDAGTVGIVDPGDTRLVPVGVTSFGNKAISNTFPLIGRTLTRGWARIENKTVVSYAQPGTKTAKLDAVPQVILPTLEPPQPPAYLKATPVTLPGGPTQLTGTGKWFIRVAAVNMYGEGEPSDSLEINFPSGDMRNAIKIAWKAVPYAISYRIYKSRNETFFPTSALLAEVKAPSTEYIDRGTVITDGTLAFPYRASFVTLWRNRGGVESELVEFRCADYEIDLATGLIRFRRALKPYEIVLANYKYAEGKTPLGPGGDPCTTVAYKDEHVYVDIQRGIGKLLHAPAVDPIIDPLNYCFRLWRAPGIDPSNPYLLRVGSDYTINFDTGEIKFSSHVVKDGDIITADYDTFEEVAGESLVEAISTGITEARAFAPVIPESYQISKAVALRSSPQIRITGGPNGYQLVFTTPVEIFVDPDNNPLTYDVVMTLNRPGRQFGTTNKGAVRNPEKAGSYQLWVSTSQEQTPILSEPYEITADKDLKTAELKIISPQVPAPVAGELPCTCKDAAATSGQPMSIVTQLMAGSNGVPGVYVRFEIVSTTSPPSTFSSASLVQTNEQGIASVVLSLSTTPGITEVKVYLQDDPMVCRCVRINTGAPPSISRIVVTPGPMLALAPGSSQMFTAKAYNASGAEVPGVNFTWAADCGTITQNGAYAAPMDLGLTCHVYARAGGQEGMCTINIMPRPERIMVTPQNSNCAIGSSVQYTGQAYDSAGNPMNVPLNWSVEPSSLGTIDTTGKFTAGIIQGTGTIKACASGVCGTATVSVQASGGIETIYITPPQSTMNVGDTQLFKATAKDKNGFEISGVSFTWSVNPPDFGTISSSGLFIAQKPGMCVIIAQTGDKSATAIVRIAQIVRVDLTPASVTLNVGQTQQFTAMAYDATGALIPGVAFSWMVTPSTLGFISQAGMFTATGSAGQSGVVTVTVAGVSKTAQVTIGVPDNTPPTITLVDPPANGLTYKTGPMPISVKVDDASGISEVTINGTPASPTMAGNWTANVLVQRGTNNFVVKAKDNSTTRNEATLSLTIYGADPVVLVMKIPINSQPAIKNVTITEAGVPRTTTFTTSPELYQGSTYVGLRDLAEKFFGATAAFGGSVAYETTTRKITITIKRSSGDTLIFECVVERADYQLTVIRPDGTREVKNGALDRIPYIGSVKYGSRRDNYNSTMVPMRAFVEAFGGTVEYVDTTRTATFTFTR